MCRKSFLTCSHYIDLIAIDDSRVRKWYEKEAIDGMWSVRTLRHNISIMIFYISTIEWTVCQLFIKVSTEKAHKFLPVSINSFKCYYSTTSGVSSSSESGSSELLSSLLSSLKKSFNSITEEVIGVSSKTIESTLTSWV